jgi:hypothetical protein
MRLETIRRLFVGILLERRLRRECERMIDALDIPIDCTDVDDLCKHISRQRKRPLILRAIPTGDIEYGAVASTYTADVVFYEIRTTPLHQDGIKLHEVAHLLFDDGTVAGDVVMQRAGYSARQEQRAEMMATLLAGELDDRALRQARRRALKACE